MTTTDSAQVKAALRNQHIETPSWAYGNSGTRFKVFAQRGVPRTPQEKIDDAAQVHRFTGVAPSVALHIPWDRVDDYQDLARHARELGISLGTINSNTFQDDLRARQDRLAEVLAAVYERLGRNQRIVLEYKLFEPAFYHTDVPDWGTAYAHCLQLGERAKVVVDTGHHDLGPLPEQIGRAH